MKRLLFVFVRPVPPQSLVESSPWTEALQFQTEVVQVYLECPPGVQQSATLHSEKLQSRPIRSPTEAEPSEDPEAAEAADLAEAEFIEEERQGSTQSVPQ